MPTDTQTNAGVAGKEGHKKRTGDQEETQGEGPGWPGTKEKRDMEIKEVSMASITINQVMSKLSVIRIKE